MSKTIQLVVQIFIHMFSFDYKSCTCLQLKQDLDPGLGESCSNLTLARLRVWTFDPLKRLKWLATLVDTCKGKCRSIVHLHEILNQMLLVYFEV